jgi:uncharacterized RDD family membrane protein YckC
MESSAPVASHGSAAPSVTAGASSTPVAHGGFRLIQRPLPVVQPTPAPVVRPAAVPGEVRLASFGRRFLATVIDNLLVSFAVSAVLPFFVSGFQDRLLSGFQSWYVDLLAGGQAALSNDLSHLVVVMTYVAMPFTVVYGVVSLSVWSRTLGQRIVGIAVSPVDKTLDKVGWAPALSRSLAWTVLSQGGGGVVLLIVNAFSLSMILWHPKRQTLPDLLARTQVVRRG